MTRILLSLVLVLGMVAPLSAQDQAAPDVANAAYQFTGVINANAVYVRSGPGDNYYPTSKLDKGASVTVVGIKFDWLKIVPPEGSFCYVAKAYVEKRGDGKVGRVTRPDLNVRAGSNLNEMKTTVQTKLSEGEDVRIIDEKDEYFRIQPPAGAFVYVNKQFVDPVKPLAAEGATPAPAVADRATTDATAGAVAADVPAPTTRETAGSAAPVAPATRDSVRTTDAEALFEKLEADYAAADKQPIEQQPIDELLKGYQSLADGNELPESMRRIAAFKANMLKSRGEARANLLEVRKIQEQMQQKQQALRAENEELQQRIKENDVKVYTAVGTLQTSSLQQGRETLYRLTDPGTGRTLVYIRGNDPQLAGLMGTFIGVKGEVVSDTQLNLKVISPTAFETVDVNLVPNRVAAQIIPPSLMRK